MRNPISITFNDPIFQSHFDLDDLQTWLTELRRARQRLQKATARLSTKAASLDEIEIAAAEVLRHNQTVRRRLRRCLSGLKLYYAVLWSFVHSDSLRGDSTNVWAALVESIAEGSETPAADSSGPAVEGLDPFAEALKETLEHFDEISEGRSRDGRVRAGIDSALKVAELDFDPLLLAEPEYRASLIEAVNAALGPAFRQSSGLLDALLAQSDPSETVEAEESQVIDDILSASAGFDIVQEDLCELLARASRGDDLASLAQELHHITETCRENERELLPNITCLRGYHAELHSKVQLATVTAADLAQFPDLAWLLIEDSNRGGHGLEGFPGAAQGRRLIDIVQDELQEQQALQESLRSLRIRTARHLSLIERRTYEGRSGDGSMTARVAGTMELLEVELAADRPAEPASIKTALIEAINQAIRAASFSRSPPMFMSEIG